MYLYSEKYSKLFKLWLIISIFTVFLIISVGGLTRITNSGLSITEWELFEGILPPLTLERWNNYFILYKEIPQFKILYPNMTLDEFKIIFYWEYIHRILGRFLGLFFLIPLVFFTLKKIIRREYLINFYFIFFLICLQGFVGWFMVSSGLTNDVTVSHYRLAMHLSVAFIIVSLMYWNYLNFAYNQKKSLIRNFSYNYKFQLLYLLVFLQIIFGAFVSGLDAGMIYQTWPLMGDGFFPNDSYNIKFVELLNFDNRSLVQFYHRTLAYLLYFYSIYVGYTVFNYTKKDLKKIFLTYFSFLNIQVVLGILTLISGLNMQLSVLHQFIGVILVLTSLKLTYRISK